MKLFLAVLVLLIGVVALCGVYVSDTPGSSATGPLSGANDDERAVATALRAHVEALAHQIGERSVHRTTALGRARDHIRNRLHKAGLAFTEQEFGGGAPGVNIEVSLEGRGARDEIVVVGAHYDTTPYSPGADDNASGCAALLEVAARAPADGYERTVRFVFFDRGSARYAGTEESGSRAWIHQLKSKDERVVAMLSLDAIGCFNDESGSQDRPFPLTFFYPDRGDFVLFAGDLGSRDLVRSCVERFRATSSFPSEGVVLPGWLPGIGQSDHAAFWSEGWPAVVVTDTGSLRNREIGKMTDTPDRLDYDRMSRVVIGVGRVVEGLARRSGFAP